MLIFNIEVAQIKILKIIGEDIKIKKMDDLNQSSPPTEDRVVTIGKYQVKVIRDLCIGASSCVAISSSTFKLDDENKAVIEEGSSDTPENILMAAQSCPTKAIVIIDTETGKQVWPA